MKYLNLLLIFTFEVVGIAVLGYVAHEQFHMSSNIIGAIVSVLILAALGKFLWLFSRWK